MNNAKKQFTYKNYSFIYHVESDPCFTWTIVTLNPESVFNRLNWKANNFQIAGDGLAEAKWLATRKLNEILSN